MLAETGLFLLLLSVYRGGQDLGSLLAPYDALLTEVAKLPPPVPPELASSAQEVGVS